MPDFVCSTSLNNGLGRGEAYKNEGWNLTQVPPKKFTRRQQHFRHNQWLPCLLFTFNIHAYALFLVLLVVFGPFGHVPGKAPPWGGMFLASVESGSAVELKFETQRLRNPRLSPRNMGSAGNMVKEHGSAGRYCF